MNKRCVKIRVDNEVFDSIKDAADFLGVNPWKITDTLRFGKDEVNGYHIERVDNRSYPTRMSIKTKPIKTSVKSIYSNRKGRSQVVFCSETGRKFNSIKEAAEYLRITPWTLGFNFKTHGKYIGRDGNEYTLTKPETKRETLTLFNYKDAEEKSSEKTIAPIQTIVSKTQSDESILKNVTIDLINKSQYSAAMAILNAINKIKD